MLFLRTGLGVLSLSIALFAAPLVGCGDSSGTGSGGGSSDGGGGGGDATSSTNTGSGSTTATATVTTGAGGGGNDCNLLTPCAAFAETREATTAPAPAGGSIMNGTFAWTSSVIYTGAGGATGPTGVMLSGSIRYGGANFEFLSVTPTEELGAAGTFTVANTDLTSTYTCPFAAAVTSGYTATNTTIAIHSTDGSRVDTYTLQ